MPPAIHVRDAREADRDLLFRFHKSLYEQILADDLRALLRDRNAHVLIAEREGRAIGYITGRISVESRRALPRRGVVEDWYVEEGARGGGVGRQLLNALEDRFRDAGCQVIESATWSGNEGARRAHDALGFREIRVIYRKLL